MVFTQVNIKSNFSSLPLILFHVMFQRRACSHTMLLLITLICVRLIALFVYVGLADEIVETCILTIKNLTKSKYRLALEKF